MGSVTPLHANVDYTGAQLALIRNTVASDCNSQEFDLFVTVARRAGLDPFRKQISAIVFNKKNADKRRMSIITGIDGLRTIAARSGRYRPDEDEAEYVYDPAEKGPHNPLGLVKATVTIWIADTAREGGWKPVKGWAYWDEFAPMNEECPAGWAWEETGETWGDSGKPKKRKVAKGPVHRVLDTSGQWGRMPRVMLAKCAEAQALRKAFPEDMSGLYEAAELDQARIIDVTPSEIVVAHGTEQRLARIGATNGITFQLTAASPLEPIPLGQVYDRIVEAARDFDLNQLRFFESVNTRPLREYWARAQGEALELKKFLEQRGAALMAEAEKADA